MNRITLLVFIIVLAGCRVNDIASSKSDEKIVLKSDFSQIEFKEAVLGKWESVWEHSGKENVYYLELNQNGKAKIIIDKNNERQKIEGKYNVDFLRPPGDGAVTFAEITIFSSRGNIVLKRVNFGLHNALPYDAGPFLRMDEEPYGVLQKNRKDK